MDLNLKIIDNIINAKMLSQNERVEELELKKRRRKREVFDEKKKLSDQIIFITIFLSLSFVTKSVESSSVINYDANQNNSSNYQEAQSSQLLNPSQLFLSQTKASPISLVVGYQGKKSFDEEEDGFIMQASSANKNRNDEQQAETTTSQSLQTQTDDINPTTTTNTITTSAEDDQRIPIDANRQQFLTHDQLNASTKDETINITQNIEATKRVPEKTSRAGMSKVSHVASFFSGKFSS